MCIRDRDNHVVIGGGAGLIQESGGQLHTILLTNTIPIGIYIASLIDVYKRQGMGIRRTNGKPRLILTSFVLALSAISPFTPKYEL